MAGDCQEALDKVERKVLDFIEENYLEHAPIKVLNTGEIIIFYLYYKGEKINNFGERDLTLYHNTWYPGEYTVNAQVSLIDGRLNKYVVNRMGTAD